MTKPMKRKHYSRSRTPSKKSSKDEPMESLALPTVGRPGRQSYCLRYALNLSGASTYTGNLTSDRLASLLSTAATSTASGNSLNMLPYLDAVKLHRVRAYAQDTSTTTGNTITLIGTFPVVAVASLSFGSRLVQETATILGTAGCAFIDMTPDPKSVQGNTVAGQSSSNVFWTYTVNCGLVSTSVTLIVDIFFSGSIPTALGGASTAITFPFSLGPIAMTSTAAGQVYAIPPFVSLGTDSSPSSGVCTNFTAIF